VAGQGLLQIYKGLRGFQNKEGFFAKRVADSWIFLFKKLSGTPNYEKSKIEQDEEGVSDQVPYMGRTVSHFVLPTLLIDNVELMEISF
jgi:hypothetical protein